MEKLFKFLTTGFYSGFSPFASGTAGTLVAIPLYLILAYLPFKYYLLLVIISLFPAAALCKWGENYFAKDDPSEVVIDEIIGYLVTMMGLPVTPLTVVAGFFIFRFFDIWKPYPIRQSESLPYGWGVLIDDVLAGIYANLTLWAVYLAYQML